MAVARRRVYPFSVLHPFILFLIDVLTPVTHVIGGETS